MACVLLVPTFRGEPRGPEQQGSRVWQSRLARGDEIPPEETPLGPPRQLWDGEFGLTGNQCPG